MIDPFVSIIEGDTDTTVIFVNIHKVTRFEYQIEYGGTIDQYPDLLDNATLIEL